jgi:adenylate kinase
MRVVFVGPPGSGKGTQAKLLQDALGLTCIGTGDMLRKAVKDRTAVGKQAKPYMDRGDLVPDSLINDVIAELFDSADHPTRFVMDGYPRTLDQAVALDRILGERNLEVDTVISLKVDEAIVLQRLIGAAGRGRPDDNPEIVQKRLLIDAQNARKIADYYRTKGILHEVDGTMTQEVVFKQIVSIVQSQPA